MSYHHGCSQIFTLFTHDACQSLIKLEFSEQIFKKYPNIKFHENSSSRQAGRPMDRHDEESKIRQGQTYYTQHKLTMR